MSNTQNPLLISSSPTPAGTPRARRGDAAVVAQYIQDITQSSVAGPLAVVAPQHRDYCVGDSAAPRIRTASTAALTASSSPTQATGSPSGAGLSRSRSSRPLWAP
jgi:hypothetical protein